MGRLPLSVHRFTGGNTNGMGGLGVCWGVDKDKGSDVGDIIEEEGAWSLTEISLLLLLLVVVLLLVVAVVLLVLLL